MCLDLTSHNVKLVSKHLRYLYHAQFGGLSKITLKRKMLCFLLSIYCAILLLLQFALNQAFGLVIKMTTDPPVSWTGVSGFDDQFSVPDSSFLPMSIPGISR